MYFEIKAALQAAIAQYRSSLNSMVSCMSTTTHRIMQREASVQMPAKFSHASPFTVMET